MTILYICKLFSSKGNGVVSAIENEIKYLQDNVNIALYNLGVSLPDCISNIVFSKNDNKSIDNLPHPFNKPDLVVFEEIYKIDYIKIYKYCIRERIPYIIIPHGSLVKLEQKKKWLKKKIANFLLFNSFIKNATAVQFLNEQEKNNSLFKYKKSIIIPNGITICNRQYDYDNNFIFIFIGRYSIYTKGLDLLLETFLDLKEWCLLNNISLQLFGCDDDGSETRKLKDFVKKNQMTDYVSINGPVYGYEKKEKLEKASVFIQTSRHEGQPMGIIEALSTGVPCIVTYETSFGEYCNKNKCGYGVSFDKDKLKDKIMNIFKDKKYWNAAKENAKQSSKRDFDIMNVTNETLKKYELLLKVNED